MTSKTIINGVGVIDELEELNKQREFCKRLGVCEKKHWERLYYSTRKKLFEEISTLEQQSVRKDERIRELEEVLTYIHKLMVRANNPTASVDVTFGNIEKAMLSSYKILEKQIKQIAQGE